MVVVVVEVVVVVVVVRVVWFKGRKNSSYLSRSLLPIHSQLCFYLSHLSVSSRYASIHYHSQGSIGATVTNGPGKIFIGGLPYNLLDEQIMELLSAFGPIKQFHQVRSTTAPL